MTKGTPAQSNATHPAATAIDRIIKPIRQKPVAAIRRDSYDSDCRFHAYRNRYSLIATNVRRVHQPAYLLYQGIFIGVSLAVSARAPLSRLALVILLAFRIVNGLIAPHAGADVAKRTYPTPSAFAFQQAVDRDLRNGLDGHDSEDKRAAELKRRVMKQYGVKWHQIISLALLAL